jgi:hypothetical protein
MANDVKKKKRGATVKDVMVPGQGGASMIDELTKKLKEALGLAKANQKKD